MKANTPDNLDELYDGLPEDERLVAMILRELVLEALPDCREKKSYGAPFYFGKRAVCFVWPASITWGGKKQGAGVTLGFHRARALNHDGYLEFGNRKTIGQRQFLSPAGIDIEKVTLLLKEAWALDQQRYDP